MKGVIDLNIDDSQKFSSFASLNRYFTLIASSKPTNEQAEKAVLALCHFCGVEDEEQILCCGDIEIINNFNKIKSEIFRLVEK